MEQVLERPQFLRASFMDPLRHRVARDAAKYGSEHPAFGRGHPFLAVQTLDFIGHNVKKPPLSKRPS